MNCLNCNTPIPEEAKYCDGLCKHGYAKKQYDALMNEHEKLKRESRAIKEMLDDGS